ncbi:hypothetical protein TWF173_010005 [Orbilia oligospora]|uniref:Uncharacterized protein n=2 Tax=Orbilia oligospora TaxID=2813651 RepID=A0A8H2DR57_ORBOL|nr:hypothetical protein TWF225_010322 [Orbilia oligospora]KAF3237008.1 hypothetical protein TWF128_001224 [Orbilia oligospora]KAF3277625.1 hypothetical protein TWF132_001437 [Orbilia oligospora]KAF3310204.1 hypothetical protein TWF173_010005 [Orbilia oligospora]TGJ65230.1 hypothetical protein EYR41_009219 [Orbilia oligospora]
MSISSSKKLASTAWRAIAPQIRQLHQSNASRYPSILSGGASSSRSQSLSEGLHPRTPVHRMKTFTPMQLTCNFQTTPPRPDAPVLLIMPQIAESSIEDMSNIPNIDILGQKPNSKVLISTPHGDTAHITSPSGLAWRIGSGPQL